MNQRIGINVSKELKNLKRRVKAPVISNGYNNTYQREKTYFYDEDEDYDMNRYSDDYDDDCFCISDNMKCTTKAACVIGASVIVGIAAACLLRRSMK